MTELSPAAQAVLDVFTEDNSLHDRKHNYYNLEALAAALRAALDEVVPEHREHHPATLDERWRKVSAFEVRNRFLAIATELKNAHDH